jgi:hypothetical protein
MKKKGIFFSYSWLPVNLKNETLWPKFSPDIDYILHKRPVGNIMVLPSRKRTTKYRNILEKEN